MPSLPKIVSSSRVVTPAIVLTVFSLAILIIYLFWSHSRTVAVLERQAELLSIVDFKVRQAEGYFRSVSDGAVSLTRNRRFIQLVSEAKSGPGSVPSRQSLSDWVGLLLDGNDIAGVQITGVPPNEVIFSSSHGFHTHYETDSARLQQAIDGRAAVISAVHFGGDGQEPGLEVFAPIIESSDLGQAVIAVMHVLIDPGQKLLDMLGEWPNSHATGEILIVRAGKNTIDFLGRNPLSGDTTQAFALEELERDSPAGLGLRGIEGIVEGRDYRGEQVLAAVRRIPSTDWVVVAKLDKAEVLRDTNVMLLLLVSAVAALVVIGILLTKIAWNARESGHLKSRLEQMATIDHLGRVQRVLSSVNKALVRIEERKPLLEEICRIAVEEGGYALCFIGTIDPMTGIWNPETAFGVGESYVDEVAASARARLTTSGPPTLSAIRTKQTVVAPDLWGVKVVDRSVEEARKHNLRSAATFPITEKSIVVGTITFMSRETGGFPDEQLRLLNELVEDLTFALDQMEVRTARVEAEQSLQRSEALLMEAQRLAQMGHYDLDVSTGKWICSTTLYEIFGIELGYTTDIDGWLRIVHPADRDGMKEYFENVVLGHKERFDREYRIIRISDGAERWVHGLGKLILGDDGRVRRMVGTIHDITERKVSNEAVARSETQFRELFDEAPVGYHEVDVSGRIMRVNQTELSMLGYDRQDMVGKCVWEFVSDPQASRTRVLAKLSGAISEDRGAERSYIKKDGTTLDVLVDERILRDEKKGIIGVRSVLQDMADLKQADLERRRLFTAIEQAAESIVMTTTSGTIVYVNPCFEAATGYSREEVLGKNPRILSSGRHDKAFYKSMWDTIIGGNTWTGRITNRRKDGSLMVEDTTISPVRDMSGTVVNFVAVKRDITKEIDLESQLIRTQKLESLGTLASGIAHDFNNILGIILGNASLLELPDIPEDQRVKSSRVISDATRRGAAIVKQLLTFARKQDETREILFLNDLVKELVGMLRETLPKTIEIRQNLQAHIPKILADVAQIHQVLLNLCVNARDAMPLGGTLTISTGVARGPELHRRFPDAVAHEYLMISVSDTGTGMDESTKARIFEPFFTTKGPNKGTGLGLSVVFGIVKRDKGFIDVDSTPGQGSVFTVYLPVGDVTPVPSNGVLEEDELPKGSETVLVIEDEEMLREFINTILTSYGYRVIFGEDGLHGVMMFDRHHDEIGIVLTDLGLPGIEGKEVVRRIRMRDPQARVIVASGFIDDQMKLDLAAQGVVDFVHKPFAKADIVRKVRKHLDAGQTTEEKG